MKGETEALQGRELDPEPKEGVLLLLLLPHIKDIGIERILSQGMIDLQGEGKRAYFLKTLTRMEDPQEEDRHLLSEDKDVGTVHLPPLWIQIDLLQEEEEDRMDRIIHHQETTRILE